MTNNFLSYILNNMKTIIEPVLKVVGLDPKESKVYEEILRNSKITIATLLKKVDIKRGDLYNVLKRLEDQKFIYSDPESKKLTYSASDPEVIERAIKINEKNLEEARNNLSVLFSLHNLSVGKPGIRFAEGIEGIKEIFNETLKAKTEIVGYADVDGWLTHLEKYVKWYGKERLRKNIKERIILPDTEQARKFMSTYDKKVTEVKFVPHNKFKFSLEMNVFDNKVIYVTLHEPFIAVLIEDKAIADTQRAIFELGWSQTSIYD